MDCLSSYFPTGLDDLVYLASLVKPRVLQTIYHTYILTAHGQIFRSLNDELRSQESSRPLVDGAKFALWQKDPVQDVYVDRYDNVMIITLDAKIGYKKSHSKEIDTDDSIEDVVSISELAHSEDIVILTVNGSIYTYDKDEERFILTKLPEPIVAQSVSSDYLLLLRTDGRVWSYSRGWGFKDIPGVEDVIALSYQALLRTDGRVYQMTAPDEYDLDEKVSDIVAVDSGDNSELYINLITRSGRILRKYVEDKELDKRQYRSLKLDVKALTVAGIVTTVILTDGRVAQSVASEDNDLMTTIPRLNVYKY